MCIAPAIQRLGRMVAIKFVSPHLYGKPGAEARLDREARLASSLKEPAIVSVFDVGHREGQPYVVMELIEGRTLAARISDGRLPIREAVEIAMQVANGLAAAQDAGVVHRDLKPQNIMLTVEGRPKVVDFGLGGVHVRTGKREQRDNRWRDADRPLRGDGHHEVHGAGAAGVRAARRRAHRSVRTGRHPVPNADRPPRVSSRFGGADSDDLGNPRGQGTEMRGRASRYNGDVVWMRGKVPGEAPGTPLCTQPRARPLSVTPHEQILLDSGAKSCSGSCRTRPGTGLRPWRQPFTVLVLAVVGWQLGRWRAGETAASLTGLRHIAVLPLTNVTKDAGDQVLSDGLVGRPPPPVATRAILARAACGTG